MSTIGIRWVTLEALHRWRNKYGLQEESSTSITTWEELSLEEPHACDPLHPSHVNTCLGLWVDLAYLDHGGRVNSLRPSIEPFGENLFFSYILIFASDPH